MTGEPVALDLLRRQVAALLSQIDTATLPSPDELRGRRHDRPGAVWRANKHWRVFTVETAEGAGFVFVDHMCDDLTYPWGEPGDWEALRIEDARRIGLSYLAAAARAEELLAGATRLDAFRRGNADTEPSGAGDAEVRTLNPRRPR